VALLRILIDRAGAPVSKDALMEAAWPGLAVEESNLTVQIAALRRALGEVPGGDRWIETLPRRGYRFVGPITKTENSGIIEQQAPPPAVMPLGRSEAGTGSGCCIDRRAWHRQIALDAGFAGET
jgi:DNA-binding winged helix-turn-helix (wHTH) protein